MASSSQRARFLLEQTVPELQELLTKEIFSQDEVSSIAKKRSDFEHLLNAREAKIGDFIRYLAYEQTLEKLKAKRVRRLGVRNLFYSSQRHVFSLFERATRKYPGDLRLWMLYLRYARAVRAHKRVGKVLTALLRLQPSNPDLWILAARFTAYVQDDINTGRGYLQRGLRFSPKEKQLWLELIGLELSFVQKAIAQLENLGVKSSTDEPDVESAPGSSYFDERALKQMSSTPAISGDIVRAVFDAAMSEFDNDARLAEDIYTRIAEFPTLNCTGSLLRHVFDFLETHQPTSSSTAVCMFKSPLHGLKSTSPEFPLALGQAIHAIQSYFERENVETLDTAQRISLILLQLSSVEEEDSDVQPAVQMALDYLLKIVVDENQLLAYVSHLEALGLDADTNVVFPKQLELNVS